MKNQETAQLLKQWLKRSNFNRLQAQLKEIRLIGELNGDYYRGKDKDSKSLTEIFKNRSCIPLDEELTGILNDFYFSCLMVFPEPSSLNRDTIKLLISVIKTTLARFYDEMDVSHPMSRHKKKELSKDLILPLRDLDDMGHFEPDGNKIHKIPSFFSYYMDYPHFSHYSLPFTTCLFMKISDYIKSEIMRANERYKNDVHQRLDGLLNRVSFQEVVKQNCTWFGNLLSELEHEGAERITRSSLRNTIRRGCKRYEYPMETERISRKQFNFYLNATKYLNNQWTYKGSMFHLRGE